MFYKFYKNLIEAAPVKKNKVATISERTRLQLKVELLIGILHIKHKN